MAQHAGLNVVPYKLKILCLLSKEVQPFIFFSSDTRVNSAKPTCTSCHFIVS